MLSCSAVCTIPVKHTICGVTAGTPLNSSGSNCHDDVVVCIVLKLLHNCCDFHLIFVITQMFGQQRPRCWLMYALYLVMRPLNCCAAKYSAVCPCVFVERTTCRTNNYHYYYYYYHYHHHHYHRLLLQ
jgi:hypothetical protein